MPGAAIGGGGGLAPFDKHPADPGALNSSAKSLADQAKTTVDVADQTLGAYAPAIANWSGIAAPEMAAAPTPMVNDAADMNLSLTWASVAVQYWAKQVESFNRKVDAILAALSATMNQPGRAAMDPGMEQATRAAALEVATRKWHEAYQTHIVAGGGTTVGMLRDGPTDQNLATAQQVGLVPASGPFAVMGRNLANQVLPDFGNPLGMAGVGLWAFGRTVAGFDIGAKVAALRASQLRAQTRTFVGGYWRTVNGQRQYIQPHWRFRADANGALRSQWANWENLNSRIGTPSRWLGNVAKPLEFGTAAAEQWARDSGRPDLNTGEKVGRAAAHSLTKGGAALAGGWAGAKIGAAIGLAGGPVGAVVGGVVGGLIGGALAAATADALNEDVVDAGEKVGDAVHNYYGSGGRPYVPFAPATP